MSDAEVIRKLAEAARRRRMQKAADERRDRGKRYRAGWTCPACDAGKHGRCTDLRCHCCRGKRDGVG